MSSLKIAILTDGEVNIDSLIRCIARLGYQHIEVPAETNWIRSVSSDDLVDFVLQLGQSRHGEDELTALKQRAVLVEKIAVADLKAVTDASLRKQLHASVERFNTCQADVLRCSHLLLKAGSMYHRVEIAAIDYAEAFRNYLELRSGEEPLRVRLTLTALMRRLPKSHFLKPHRSYVVAKRAITDMRRGYLHVAGKRIPVSDTGMDQVLSFIETKRRQEQGRPSLPDRSDITLPHRADKSARAHQYA